MRPFPPVAAIVMAGAPAVALDCRIETHPGLFGTELRAVASSLADVSAEWRFEVERVSLAGRSSNAQGGRGVLRAGQDVVIGRVTLGGGGRTDARLTVTAGPERASCSLP
ncbi:MAG: curli-like amyloid fiber formation chaperone CsgH [Hasllibacter sp.]